MNQAKPSDNIFIMGMVLSMTCWGIAWTSGKVLAQYGTPLPMSFLRFGFTFVALFGIVLLMREKLTIQKSGLKDLTIAAALQAIYTFLFFKGLYHGKAGAGGVLVTILNPIVAYAITIGLAKRKPTRNETAGLLLGILAGLILLKVFTRGGDILSAGNIWFVLAAVMWALLSRFTARARAYGSSVTFSFWLSGISALFILPFSGLGPAIDIVVTDDWIFWLNMIFSAVITSALATTFYFVATARVGASRASSFIFLVPFSAAIGAWLLIGETIERHTVIGGVLGIAAVYMLNRKE